MELTHYVPKFFSREELFPPETCLIEHSDTIWRLMDPRILWTIDALRKIYGPAIINTWHWTSANGFHYRGFRPANCKVGLTKTSQHFFGRAVDMTFVKETVEYVRVDIINNHDRDAYKYITGIEIGVPWLHIDCRNYDGLLIFTP